MASQSLAPLVIPTTENQLMKVTAAREARLQAARVLFEGLEACNRHVMDSNLGDAILFNFPDRMRAIIGHARIWVRRSLNLSELDLGILLNSSEELRWFEERYEICKEPEFPFDKEVS